MFGDGVRVRQFDKVLRKEVMAVKEGLKEVGGSDYNPLITWTVDQKWHYTKL